MLIKMTVHAAVVFVVVAAVILATAFFAFTVNAQYNPYHNPWYGWYHPTYLLRAGDSVCLGPSCCYRAPWGTWVPSYPYGW